MTERVDNLQYTDQANISGETRFITGPAEFLCYEISRQLVLIPQWVKIFGENIDAYQRMDYPLRALPAVRIYNKTFTKQTESWFIEGDVIADLIFPPSIRRRENQQYMDTISSAMLQQFRSPEFFKAMNDLVPGLNELGKKFDVDKSLAFELGESDLAPLTQVTLNFRLDLREWDLYLEQDNRTKDTPFERTLANLDQIVSEIQGLRDAEETEVTIGIDQKV